LVATWRLLDTLGEPGYSLEIMWGVGDAGVGVGGARCKWDDVPGVGGKLGGEAVQWRLLDTLGELGYSLGGSGFRV
jgi:hypothetical protein